MLLNGRQFIVIVVFLWVVIGLLAGFDIRGRMVKFVGPAMIAACAMVLVFSKLQLLCLARMAESFILVSLIGSFGVAASMIAIATSPFPISDIALLRWEQAIGFNWLQLQKILVERPTVLAILHIIYFSFAPVTFAIAWSLDLGGHGHWRNRYLWAFFFGLNLTSIVAFLIPSISQAVHLEGNRAGLPSAYDFLFEDLPVVETLRDGGMRSFSPFVGAVAMPSFHTAGAVIFAFGLWVYPRLRILAIISASVIIVTAMTIGGHYLADIIVGLIVAIVSIEASRTTLTKQQGIEATHTVHAVTALSQLPLDGPRWANESNTAFIPRVWEAAKTRAEVRPDQVSHTPMMGPDRRQPRTASG